MGALLSRPWRDLPQSNKENLDFVKSYQPKNKEVKHLRILLHGPVGAGKSSFINSVESVLRDRIAIRAPTDATSGSSFTKHYTTYKIQKEDKGFYSLVFNDIMGLEDSNGVLVEDVKLALMGHVKEGYKFSEDQLMENDLGYNSSPSRDDRAHVLVSVIPADKVSLLSESVVKKMREIRLAASEIRIPHVVILTKVDEACPKVKDNVKNVYKSKYLKKQVETINQLLGLPLNCIFLVKNYNSELKTNPDTDKLILCALKQMILYGEDFLNDL